LQVGTDNPLTCALLALLRAAAHPGDTSAMRHVAMTPMQRVLQDEECTTSDALAMRMLGEIHENGFEQTIEAWLRKLEPALAPDDAFSRQRGRQLADAGRLFDESGSRDVAEFVHFVERYTIRDTDTAAVVRVMTVHKAKGLGFDLVILPDLEGTKLATRRRSLAVQRASDRSVEWVFDLPAETFYAQDKVLAAHVDGAEADACYEGLAMLYVAMTRAKRAMYLIIEPVGTSQSRNFPRLLQETLGEKWAQGDARWFDHIEALGSKHESKVEPVMVYMGDATPRRPTHAPSDTKSGQVSGERLFALEGAGAAYFGRLVHAKLAQVEWAGPMEMVRFALWHNDGAAGREALACLLSSDLKEIWTKPAYARVEVWRERAFEIVLDGVWVTGVFDRVVVCYDEVGCPQRAQVYDFKTDRGVGGDLVRASIRHANQVALYRRVVGKLTRLPITAVSAEVVFTERARRVAVDPSP
jgi:hypothetical protein